MIVSTNKGKKGMAMLVVVCVMALITALSLSVVYAGTQAYSTALNKLAATDCYLNAHSLSEVIRGNIELYLSENSPDPTGIEDGLSQILKLKLNANDTIKMTSEADRDVLGEKTVEITVERHDLIDSNNQNETKTELWQNSDNTTDIFNITGIKYEVYITVKVSEKGNTSEVTTIYKVMEKIPVKYSCEYEYQLDDKDFRSNFDITSGCLNRDQLIFITDPINAREDYHNINIEMKYSDFDRYAVILAENYPGDYSLIFDVLSGTVNNIEFMHFSSPDVDVEGKNIIINALSIRMKEETSGYGRRYIYSFEKYNQFDEEVETVTEKETSSS